MCQSLRFVLITVDDCPHDARVGLVVSCGSDACLLYYEVAKMDNRSGILLVAVFVLVTGGTGQHDDARGWLGGESRPVAHSSR